jgi:hypothetical protein
VLACRAGVTNARGMTAGLSCILDHRAGFMMRNLSRRIQDAACECRVPELLRTCRAKKP